MFILIVKLFLLASCSFLCFLTIRLPNASTKPDKVKLGYFFDNHINIILYTLILPSLLFPIFGECVAVISASLSSSNKNVSIARTCSYAIIRTNDLQSLSLPFILASVFTIIGASLRLLCYRTLGVYFTAEITICPGHRLVDSGPYGIVRHPGYSAPWILYTGLFLFVFHPQSHINICDWSVSSKLFRVFSYVWACVVIYIMLGMIRRIPIEEENLRSHFGKTWEDHKRRVPYKLIPGIY